MKVQITRTMTVANANGEAETFEPTGEGKFRDDIDIGTYQRLNRAGAAVIHVEDGDEAEEKHPNMTTDAETATASDSTNGVYDPLSKEARELRGDTGTDGNGDEGQDGNSGETKGVKSDEELNAMTKAELEAFAKDNDYEFDPSKKKDEMIADLKVQFPA